MYSIATIKAAVAASSMVLGAGAVAVTVGIQQNPLLFTSPQPPVIEVPYVPRQAPVMPSPVAAVVIPEVQITAVPQKFVAEEPIRRLTPPAPKKAVEAPEVIDLSQDRVIPAPCNDGEYRKLDEQRGVRLMCPGSY
ncbi:MAG: DUF3352 domain-containing protein [Polyangiaceae bacterium]|nr:DUF3352 domain-containing protein [Polyangiaceae bacterium]